MTQLLLDPRPPLPEPGRGAAARLDSLDGAVIALVHNGKTHGRELMEMVIDELRPRWDIADVVHLGPPSPGYGGDPADAFDAYPHQLSALKPIRAVCIGKEAASDEFCLIAIG